MQEIGHGPSKNNTSHILMIIVDSENIYTINIIV
jgi:hypothetical protein